MIRRILVPTDFSDNAFQAYQYAQAFCRLADQAVMVVAYIFSPEAPEDPEFILPYEVLMDRSRERMEKFLQRSVGAEQPLPQQVIAPGFPADELIRMSAAYDMIIMGTTGEGGVLQQLFGSVSSRVALHAKCPVWLIPPGVHFRQIRHLLYATDVGSVEGGVLDKLSDLNRLFQATIHFVHVADESTFIDLEEKVFRTIFREGDPPFPFEMTQIAGEEVVRSIHDYARAHQIDLIVMATHRRHFWYDLFRRSQTKQMILQAEFPMMVFHLG